jgi:hypothetical protein
MMDGHVSVDGKALRGKLNNDLERRRDEMREKRK